MKKYLFLICLLFWTTILFAQNPTLKEKSITYRTHLSLEIRKLIQESDTSYIKQTAANNLTEAQISSLIKVMRFCLEPIDPQHAVPAFKELEECHAYLESLPPPPFIMLPSGSRPLPEESITETPISPPRSSIGGIEWQAAMLAGLTNFLLQRAKDEVTLSFVKDLQQILEKPENEVWIDLFPNFHTMISQSDQITFQAYIPTIREAAIEDFNNLPINLIDKAADHISTNTDAPATVQLLPIAMRRVKEIYLKTDPILSLSHLADETYPEDLAPPVSQSLKCIGVIALEYYVVKKINLFSDDIGTTDLLDFLKDPAKRDLFLRFLLNGLGLHLDKLDYNLELSVIDIIGRLEDLDSIVKTFKEDISQLSNVEYAVNYAHYLGAFSDFIKAGAGFLTIETDPAWLSFVSTFDRLIDIQLDVMNRDFNRVVIQAVSLLQDRFFISEIPDDQARPHYVKILKVLVFAASLAEAQNKDDIQHTLEAFADPVGSFRAKRAYNQVRPYFSINSYLGYGGGPEWLNTTVSNLDNQLGVYQGISLPLGLEFGITTSKKGIASAGVLLSFIDLGNLASFRLSGNDLDSLQVNSQGNITFKQVFAPGAGVVLGFSKNKPITLGFGYQYVPELRSLEENTFITNRDLDVHRVNVHLSVDLTIFRF